MKLHLPKLLRNSVLACITAVAGVATTTVGTATFTGGVVAFALANQQAMASEVLYGPTSNNSNVLSNAAATDTIIIDMDRGYFTGACTIEASVQINNAVFTDGWSSQTYTFKNVVTGTGRFSYEPTTGCNNNEFVFDGDVSGYSGDMSVAEAKSATFTFNDKSGNGSITAVAGTVNANDATMNNSSIRVKNLNVSGSSSFIGSITSTNTSIAAGSIVSLQGADNALGALTLDVGALTGDSVPMLSAGTNALTATSLTIVGAGGLSVGTYDLISTTTEAADALIALYSGIVELSNVDGLIQMVVADGVIEINTNTSIKTADVGTRGYDISKDVELTIGEGDTGAATAGSEYNYGDITVGESSKVRFHLWTSTDVNIAEASKVEIQSDISLSNEATLYFVDGSYYMSGDITVADAATATIETQYGKGQILDSLKGGSDSTIILKRGVGDKTKNVFSLQGENEFAGTVVLNINNNQGGENWVVLNDENTLKNAAIDTGNQGKRNVLAINVEESSIRSLSGNGQLAVYGAGLNGDGSSNTEAELKVTAAQGTFSGIISDGVILNVTGGKQTLQDVTLDGRVEVGAGAEVVISGTTALNSRDDILAQNGFNQAFSILSGEGTKTVAEGAAWSVYGEKVTGTMNEAGVLNVEDLVYHIREEGSVVEDTAVSGEIGYEIKAGDTTLKISDFTTLTEGIVVNVGEGNSTTIQLVGSVVGAESAVSVVSGSAKYNIGEEAKFTVTSAGTILNATGTGAIHVDGNMLISGLTDGNFTTTTFQGKLVVDSGRLSLGSDTTGAASNWRVDLTNLSSIDLNGGDLYIFTKACKLSDINVLKSGKITLWSTENNAVLVEDVTVGDQVNLLMNATWSDLMQFETLSNNGKLENQVKLTVKSLSGTGSIINKDQLTLGVDETSQHSINQTIINESGATITLNGSVTADLALLKVTGTESGLSANEGQDGYMTYTDGCYVLIQNNGGTVNLNSTSVNYGDGTATLDKDDATGWVTFSTGESDLVDTIYRVNNVDIVVGGTDATEDTDRATGFIIGTDRGVTINKDGIYSVDMQNSSSLSVNAENRLNFGEKGLKGNLIIGEGGKVTLDRQDTVNYDGAVAITINGGELVMNNARQTIGGSNTLNITDATISGTGDTHGAIDYISNNTLTANGTNIISAPVRLRSGELTVNVESGTTKVDNFVSTAGQGDTGKLKKTGSGTLEITEGISIRGDIINEEGTLNFSGSSITANGVNVAIHGQFNVLSDVVVKGGGNRLDIAADGNLVMMDGASITKSVNGAMWVQGIMEVAAGASAEFSMSDDLHLNHQSSNAKILVNAGASLKLEAKSVQYWASGASIELGENAVLDLNTSLKKNSGPSNFKIKMAAGSVINLNGDSYDWGSSQSSSDDLAVGSTVNLNRGTLSLELHAGRTNPVTFASKINIADGAKLHVYDGLTDFAGGLAINGNVILSNTWAKGSIFSGLIEGDSDAVVTMEHNKDFGSCGVEVSTFSAANTFAGTWKVSGDWDLKAAHEKAFEKATMNLNDEHARLVLGVANVKVGSLTGELGSVVNEDGATARTLELATTGTAEYKGSVAANVNITMNGSGEQKFTGDMTGFNGNVSVLQGTLTFADGLSTANREVAMAAGATLNTALELNGGTLSLDATGTAASLGDNVLTLGADKTQLVLTLLDNVNSSTPITLLNGIGGELTLAEGATLGDYFTMETITVISSTGVALLDEGTDLRSDLTVDRLLASGLTLEDGNLVLSLVPASLATDPLYWETVNGNGDWSGLSWSAENADAPKPPAIDPGKMGTDFNGEVVFNGDADAEVNIDVTAKVKDMTVESGKYTYTSVDNGSLTVTETLTIGEDAEAIFDISIAVKDIELTSNTSTLVLKGGVDMAKDGSLTAVNGGTIVQSGTDYIELKNATLGGTATKDEDGNLTVDRLVLEGGITFTDTTITGAIDNDRAALQLNGTTTIDVEAMGDLISDDNRVVTYKDVNDADVTSTAKNGYEALSIAVDLFTSFGVTEGQDHKWVYTDGRVAHFGYDDETGLITFSGEVGTEYKAADTSVAVQYDAADAEFGKATVLVLNGGSIVLNTGLDKGEDSKLTGGIRADKDGSVTISSGVILDDADVNANGHTVTVLGTGTYDLGTGTTLGTGVVLGGAADNPETADVVEPTWNGTVSTAATAITGDLNALGNAKSALKLTKAVTATGEVNVAGIGKVTFAEGLTLGTKDAAAKLTADTLDLDTLALAHIDSSLVVTELVNDALNIKIEKDVLSALADGDTRTLLEVTNDATLAGLSFNGQSDCTLEENGAKYHYTIGWESATTVRADASGSSVVLSTTVNPDYVKQNFAAAEKNAQAGAALLDGAFVKLDPQNNRTENPGLAGLLDAVDAGKMSEDTLASVAGASTAVLGMAAMGDVERQLRAIRNRTTTMGVDQSVTNDDMPYFNAWINAEGDMSELNADGTAGGYKLNSWGGTVGFDVDFCPTLTAGMALTAMYGDLDATGADTATGNMDSYYVSVFARYAPSAWTHTFVATVGTSDISLDRTVAGAQLEGESSGMSFGLMYEVGHVIALDEDATACLQPVFNVTWKHSTVDGYTEKGGDLALEVGEQTMDTVTFGLGARLQAIVGESMYNRTSILEARVLAKLDAGDRKGSSDVALSAVPGVKSSVESAEMGAFGIELGAGLTIPMGQDGGSVFMDASVELRGDYTNANGTVGYRINF